MPVNLIIIVVAVLGAFLILLALSGHRCQRRAQKITQSWMTIAEKNSWQLQPAEYLFFWKPPILSKEIDCVQVSVRCFLEDQGDVRLNLKKQQLNPLYQHRSVWTKAETPTAIPEFFFSAWLRLNTEKPVQCLRTDDQDFDRIFNAYSEPADIGGAIFDPTVQRHLMELALLSPDNVFLVSQKSMNTVEIHWGSIESRCEAIEHAAAALVAISRVLDRIR